MEYTNKNENKTAVELNKEIAIINEQTIRDKIYEVRGVKVMLDFELAEIYGYSTSAFNQQIKRNEERFDDDFRFQLTRDEVDQLSISQFVISMQTKGVRGGRAKLPYAFTESGIYMLMTVLKGDLAVQQSKALIRTFRTMKDYIVENKNIVTQHDYLRLSMQVSDTQQAVQNIQSQLIDHGEKLNDLFTRMQDTVKNSEISPFLIDFSREEDRKEYLILNGEPAKADETYMDIYNQAKNTVYIVDNYIGIKTLRLLRGIRNGVSVIVFSDNLSGMHKSDYNDFHTEFPNIPISFKETGKTTHDRFIILDFATNDEKIFHCGASSKDAGTKLMTAITEITDEDFKLSYHQVIQHYLSNPMLILK